MMPSPDEYDVNTFLKRAESMSWLDLVTESHREFRNLQNLRITPKHPLYALKSKIDYYTSFLGEFCFMISQLRRPAGMTDEQFQQTRSVLESLVEKKQLKANLLEMYR
jgi:hypothetical protein